MNSFRINHLQRAGFPLTPWHGVCATACGLCRGRVHQNTGEQLELSASSCPFGPGGANDLLARAAAEGASKVLGQPIVIDNKPGAGAVLGTDMVAKAAPDGYTFLISAAGVVSNSMIRKVPYKDSDLVPVAMIGLAPSVIVVPAKLGPYRDLKDFVEASKKGAGLHFGTAGVGSTPHFVEGILTTEYGAKLDLMPYKSGGESVAAVIGNQLDATSEASIVVLPTIRRAAS
jgi:tripartite-type tricarboxylate transporter receptor subunit TctC